jgi:hypothetical protein
MSSRSSVVAMRKDTVDPDEQDFSSTLNDMMGENGGGRRLWKLPKVVAGQGEAASTDIVIFKSFDKSSAVS